MVASFLKAIDLSDRQQKLWLDQWSAVFHGYAEAASPPAWARISSGGQVHGLPTVPAHGAGTGRKLDDSGTWVEIPYSDETAPERRHHPVVVAIVVILLTTTLFVTAAAVWPRE